MLEIIRLAVQFALKKVALNWLLTVTTVGDHYQKGTMAFLLLAACLFAMAGCSNPEADIVGTWAGSGSDPVLFKADHTFEGNIVVPFSGTWTRQGKLIRVSIAKVSGKPVAEFEKAIKLMMKNITKSPEVRKYMGAKKFKELVDMQGQALEEEIAFFENDLDFVLSGDSKVLTAQAMGTTYTYQKVGAK